MLSRNCWRDNPTRDRARDARRWPRVALNHRHADVQSLDGCPWGLLINHLKRLPTVFPSLVDVWVDLWVVADNMYSAYNPYIQSMAGAL